MFSAFLHRQTINDNNSTLHTPLAPREANPRFKTKSKFPSRRTKLDKKNNKNTQKQHTQIVRPHRRIPVRQRQMLCDRLIQLLLQYKHNIIHRIQQRYGSKVRERRMDHVTAQRGSPSERGWCVPCSQC